VKNPKPAPDIFLKAASELSLNPEDCIAFEDATMGIEGAKAANMYCIGLATTLDKEELNKAGADMAVNDYNELLQTNFFS
jgi:beta-phosphoglucomutase-like phosphatase (HAD superfamily)